MTNDLWLDRRTFFGSGAAVIGASLFTASDSSAHTTAAHAAQGVPKDFLWGVSTAGHQTEGNNVSSDLWVLENITPSPFKLRSGDAADSYHRWGEDLEITRSLGLNAYRLSIEWSRIEPEEGHFSIAELDHYRRILLRCKEMGLLANVTLNHFSSPRWFAARGAWSKPDAPDLFARYAERVARHMGDLIGMAVPFNEPNAIQVLKWSPKPIDAAAVAAPLMKLAAAKVGSNEFSSFLFSSPNVTTPVMIRAHDLAMAALKSGPGDYPVGAIVSMSDDQPVDGGEAKVEQMRREVYADWLEVARRSDFVGVQVYTRYQVGPEGVRGPPGGAVLTSDNMEYYPAAVGNVVRYTVSQVKVPIYVTENGIATPDDRRRIAYIEGVVSGLKEAIASGADLRGYFHWALLDCWAFNGGAAQPYGLVAVEPETFRRLPKPSAHRFGAIARANGTSL